MKLGPPMAIAPKDWGARVDYDKWRDLYTPDDGVALHHGGGGDYRAGREPFSAGIEAEQLRAWERFHIDTRGWRGLAYGWAVGQSGTIFRARGWATYGAHTGDVDGDGIANNAEIIPILFIGSGNHHTLSPMAQESIESLRRWIEASAPKARRLYGHTELRGTATSCPGPRGMTYVKAHRYLEELDMPRFRDVPEDHDHYKAVEWLAAEEITQGIRKDDPKTPADEDEFGPDLPVTRAQFATMLKRYNDAVRAGRLP